MDLGTGTGSVEERFAQRVTCTLKGSEITDAYDPGCPFVVAVGGRLVPITCGLNHVATLTPDLDRLVRFYADVFGAEVAFTMDADAGQPRLVILDLGGGAALNAFEVPAEEIIGERRRLGGRGPIDHFALAVTTLAELEAVRDRLLEVGADVGDVQQLGSDWSLFFRDVDGMELEVCVPVAAG